MKFKVPYYLFACRHRRRWRKNSRLVSRSSLVIQQQQASSKQGIHLSLMVVLEGSCIGVYFLRLV